ncbi:YcxB family protein [Actinoplanes sp. NPDC026619]|uniref:YcxB family protein n=1 Tax=Actinoplanes sp. NPDC026619 TaxID=3155798 RepID=UPI0033EEBC96
MLTARGLGWAAIALALMLEVVRGGSYLTLVLVGALIAVGVPMLLINAGTRSALEDSDLTTYEITDGGVASSSLASRHAYAWNAFRDVEEAPGQLIFRHSRTRFLPVPTGTLSRPQIEQILGTAAGHGLRVRRA